MANLPSVTVRSLAEMLLLPAYEQVRILSDQKYPKKEPQVFMIPYYGPALNGIRSFYKQQNDKKALVLAKSKIESIGVESRREHNKRVLDKFERSAQRDRKLTPQLNPKTKVVVKNVEVRLSPDLRATENGKERIIFYNCRSTPVTDQLAKLTLEAAHWVLERAKVNIPIGMIEYVDLTTGKAHITKKRRPATVRVIEANVGIIETLWPTV